MVKLAAAEGICIIIVIEYIRGIVREYSCTNIVFEISKIVYRGKYF